MIEGGAMVTTDEVAMVMIAVVVVATEGTDMMTDEVVAMMIETVMIAIGSRSTFNLLTFKDKKIITCVYRWQ